MLGERDGGVDVDAAHRAVAVDVGVDDGGDAGVLETQREVERATVLCSVQPSTATMPSRASMPTAIWPGHCLQAALTRPGSLHRDGAQDHPADAGLEPARDALDGADAAAQLGRHLDRLQDLVDGRAVDRMALDRAVEIDQVQPFAAGIGEGLAPGRPGCR